MARGKTEQKERKTPERMGGFSDTRLADAIAMKLFKLIGPIQSRPRFQEVRSLLFQLMLKCQTLSQETADEPEA